MKMLEIGSGNKPKEGYIHFDVRKNVNADFVGDAKKLPFKDAEFDKVYSRFFLEHLTRKDAITALKEVNRVLKTSGELELIVPDLAYFCKLFLDEKGQKKEWALNKIYGFENYKEDHHYFGYDFETLTSTLKEAEFIDIKRLGEIGQYLNISAKKPKLQ